MMFCPNCGAKNNPESKFCINCGCSLNVSSGAAAAASAQETAPGRPETKGPQYIPPVPPAAQAQYVQAPQYQAPPVPPQGMPYPQSQPYPYAQAGRPLKVFKSHLAMSIVSVFFFWPLAIAAIVNASGAKKLYNAGNFAGADAKAGVAKIFAIIGIIIGCLFIAAYISFWIYLLASGSSADVGVFGYTLTFNG